MSCFTDFCYNMRKSPYKSKIYTERKRRTNNTVLNFQLMQPFCHAIIK